MNENLNLHEIPVDTPMLCSDSKNISSFCIMFYAGEIGGSHGCWRAGYKSFELLTSPSDVVYWRYMIPFTMFDPNDVEGSIKNYNIVSNYE